MVSLMVYNCLIYFQSCIPVGIFLQIITLSKMSSIMFGLLMPGVPQKPLLFRCAWRGMSVNKS